MNYSIPPSHAQKVPHKVEMLDDRTEQDPQNEESASPDHETDSWNSAEISRSGSLDILSKLCEHRVLTRQEERRFLERYHNPECSSGSKKEAFEILVGSNIKLILRVSKFYSDTWRVPIEDLVQEGVIGLIRAIERFDLERNLKLSTYATNWIRQSVSRQSPVLARNIRLPSHVIQSLHKINKVRAEFERETGRTPSEHDLANRMKMDIYKLQNLLGIEKDTASLNEKVGPTETSELGDLVAAESFFKEIDDGILSGALQKLGQRQKQVIYLRHIEKMKLTEITAVMDISLGEVRSILRSAEIELRKSLLPFRDELLSD